MDEDKVRLYVGGLSSEISAGDLRERFGPLGFVKSVFIVPAKTGDTGHRRFAYVDFVPSTDANLRKLFSAYNGCRWRGGVLRIEKAKEDFMARLHREWAAGAATEDISVQPVELVQEGLSQGGSSKDNKAKNQEMTVGGLKLFFPSLRKLKTVPLKGLGKHKRSFQRVESSPLHLLLTCACDKQSEPCECDGRLSNSKTSLEGDDISIEIIKERDKQLELLKRLFPSDIPSSSLEDQEIVEFHDYNKEGFSGHEVPLDQAVNTTGSVVPQTERGILKQDPLLQRSRAQIVSEEHLDETVDKEMKLEYSLEQLNNEIEDTRVALAEEQTMQLELMDQLFPKDSRTSREPDQLKQSEGINVKKKMKKRRKLDDLQDSEERTKSITKTSKSRITAGDRKFHKTKIIKDNLQQIEEYMESQLQQDDLVESHSDGTGNFDRQEKQLLNISSVCSNGNFEKSKMDLLDLEMTLNLGDEPVSIATAEEQERQVLMGMAPENSRNPGLVTQLEIPQLNLGTKAQDGNVTGNGENYCEEEDEQVHSEIKAIEPHLQTSEVKGMVRQVNQPSKWDTLAELCLFREVETVGKTKGSGHKKKFHPPMEESNEVKPSNPTPVAQVDKSRKSVEQQIEVEPGPNFQLNDFSMSGPKLTRAVWKSLVGETGRVVFSLSQLTDSNRPQVLSTTEETNSFDNVNLDLAPVVSSSPLEYKKANSKPPVIVTNLGARIAQNVDNTPLVPPKVLSGDLCPFMKSENAEEEWLATKSELRLDYKAKHKHAARSFKKLSGKLMC